MFARRLALLALPLLCLPARAGLAAPFETATETVRRSVVKVYSTIQRPDYAIPWQEGHPGSGTGTGFLVGKRRILTNAHVVSDARLLQVQRDNDPNRYEARALFIGHDCDIAILTVDDPAFFRGTESLTLASALPQLNDEVTVFGYPLGGDRLSVTRGVVSRIDYSAYSHSGVDLHLVLQVDAAINPGNSGGPVIQNGHVVGLAFQALSVGENIGYAIPLPVVRRFLTDVEDGTYEGYPELGAQTLDIRNPALRQELRLPPGKSGIAVSFVDPFASGSGHLKPRDVLLAIDGHPIADDGSIDLRGNTVTFAELMERKQVGQNIELLVWRDGTEQKLTVPLGRVTDPFVYRNVYGVRPRYYMRAGYVFAPLSRELLRTVDTSRLDANEQRLFYCMKYVKEDALYRDRDEFVVLAQLLPHPINSQSEGFLRSVVETVDGEKVRNLQDLKQKLEADAAVHVIGFHSSDDFLVLETEPAVRATREIARRYGVEPAEYIGEPSE